MPSARLARLLTALLIAPASLAACSFLLEDSIEQCSSNDQCSSLRSGYVCDRAEGVCVREGGLGGSGGNGSSGGTNNPTACSRTNKEVEVLPPEINRNTTLYCSKDYQLDGYVRVLPGATLTIQAGTRLLGGGSTGDNDQRGTLIVLPGARVEADGRPDSPIVFTSAANPARRGDWGGVAILGKAPLNLRDAQGNPVQGELDGVTEPILYGGDDPNDNSGFLRYVRIEYGGLALGLGSELNGLTLAGVGKGTTIDYVQVRETLDDCFTFSGGTVDAKHLICQGGFDDGFDIEQGYRGRLQFLVMQQRELPPDAFLPNGIEIESDPSPTPPEPFTEPTIYNATLCGHGNANASSVEQYGLLLREGAKGHLFNMLVSGYDAGLDVRDATTVANANDNSLEVGSTLFYENVTNDLAYAEEANGADRTANDDGDFDESDWVTKREGNGVTKPAGVGDCFDTRAMRLAPASPLTQGATPPPNDGFFDPSAVYYGAFRNADDAWASGAWVVWQ
ncbi:MAG: hypothetical protein MUF34_20035 [Polyangiaceae bacterium]|nr:hypothetical protein [Polyangiaceae bacterium]